jgi:hypothetical protein
VSAENREFIERPVKSSAFDVYRNLPYFTAVGSSGGRSADYQPPNKKVTSAAIKAANCLIQVEIEGRRVLAHWPGEPSRVEAAVDVVPSAHGVRPGVGSGRAPGLWCEIDHFRRLIKTFVISLAKSFHWIESLLRSSLSKLFSHTSHIFVNIVNN